MGKMQTKSSLDDISYEWENLWKDLEEKKSSVIQFTKFERHDLQNVVNAS